MIVGSFCAYHLIGQGRNAERAQRQDSMCIRDHRTLQPSQEADAHANLRATGRRMQRRRSLELADEATADDERIVDRLDRSVAAEGLERCAVRSATPIAGMMTDSAASHS